MGFRPHLACGSVPLGPCSELKKNMSPLKLGDLTLISRFLVMLKQVEDLATLGPGDLGQTVAVPFRGG